MALAKCFCCGASATAPTFEQAIKKLNHAIGLSRGIKCGAFRDNIKEMFVKPTIPTPVKTKPKELVESDKYFEELKEVVTSENPPIEESQTIEQKEKSETKEAEKPKKEKKSKKPKAKKE